jgi:DNA-binding transcriptional LysR family regulator
MLTHVICAAEVRAGRLVRVLRDWALPTVPISATFLERRHLPRRVRAFLDHVAQAIQTQPDVE